MSPSELDVGPCTFLLTRKKLSNLREQLIDSAPMVFGSQALSREVQHSL
jgi:hypothetical protein